jgi:hypothetical protein
MARVVGSDVADASASNDNGGSDVCQIGIVLDNAVLAAPAIQAVLHSTSQITGSFDRQSGPGGGDPRRRHSVQCEHRLDHQPLGGARWWVPETSARRPGLLTKMFVADSGPFSAASVLVDRCYAARGGGSPGRLVGLMWGRQGPSS